jgi:hypothetical protein
VAAAFRVVGDGLFDLLNEAGEWGPEEQGPSPQSTYGEVRAACEDLDHLARYLEEVAGERDAADLDAVSAVLAQEAWGWADRLTVLVTEIRQSLDREAGREGRREESPIARPGDPGIDLVDGPDPDSR